MTDVHILLFDDFETLDAFGPAEILGRLPEAYRMQYYSLEGGTVTSSQWAQVVTRHSSEIRPGGILLLPGGMGTRRLVNNAAFIDTLRRLAQGAAHVLTICTGAALLAKTGLLDGIAATSNKLAFDWVRSVNPRAGWVPHARWVAQGKFYTSSGVSAGMDMALGFVADQQGAEAARRLAHDIEYIWNESPDHDPFARQEGPST